MTGTRLFFQFALPCLEVLFNGCKISLKHFWELKDMELNGDPDIALLVLCFPRPANSLREYAKENGGIGKMWDEEMVREFILNHEGNTPVEVLKVERETVLPFSSGVAFWLSNERIGFDRYKINPAVGDIVIVHQNTVIDKM